MGSCRSSPLRSPLQDFATHLRGRPRSRVSTLARQAGRPNRRSRRRVEFGFDRLRLRQQRFHRGLDHGFNGDRPEARNRHHHRDPTRRRLLVPRFRRPAIHRNGDATSRPDHNLRGSERQDRAGSRLRLERHRQFRFAGELRQFERSGRHRIWPDGHHRRPRGDHHSGIAGRQREL